jgi:hypothetical protein
VGTIHTYTYTHTNTNSNTYTYTYIYMYICICIYKNIYLYIHTYIHTHTHTHTGPPGSFLPFLVMQCAKPSLVVNLGLKMEIYKKKLELSCNF